MKISTSTSGLPARKSRARPWLALLALILPLTPASADDAPDLALLEFLGQWQEEDEGQWLDPLAMQPLLDEKENAPQPQSSQEEQTND